MKLGSITVFCAMCMMLVVSLLLVLLESLRDHGLDFYAKLKAEAGADSVCAEFQPLLWQEYGLLALDGAYGTEHFSLDYVTERLNEYVTKSCENESEISAYFGMDLFCLELSESELTGYALMTDENGELFLNYVAEREKEDLALGVVENIYEIYEKSKLLETSQDSFSETFDEARQMFESAKASKWREINAKAQAAETEEEEKAAWAEAAVFNASGIKTLEAIFGSIRNAQTSGILQLILGDVSTVSGKNSIPLSRLKTREKESGTMQYTEELDWYKKALVVAYLREYFSNYTSPDAEHFLSYEMEYVLCGKGTEWENLEAALNRILLVREAANVCFLLQDSEKMQEAETMAKAVGLLIGENPVAVKCIQTGLIGAWAFAESVLDVRALVAGDKISLIKGKEEWMTDISQILTVFGSQDKAKNCENGLGYVDYLAGQLFFSANEDMAYRMMETMELSLQMNVDYENCKMNQMLIAIRYRLQFESNPVFFSLMTIGDAYDGKFSFVKEAERSYIP